MVSYYFCILIAESVKRNEDTKDATDKSIQECLSKWFTGAKDRNVGRVNRKFIFQQIYFLKAIYVYVSILYVFYLK